MQADNALLHVVAGDRCLGLLLDGGQDMLRVLVAVAYRVGASQDQCRAQSAPVAQREPGQLRAQVGVARLGGGTRGVEQQLGRDALVGVQQQSRDAHRRLGRERHALLQGVGEPQARPLGA